MLLKEFCEIAGQEMTQEEYEQANAVYMRCYRFQSKEEFKKFYAVAGMDGISRLHEHLREANKLAEDEARLSAELESCKQKKATIEALYQIAR